MVALPLLPMLKRNATFYYKETSFGCMYTIIHVDRIVILGV